MRAGGALFEPRGLTPTRWSGGGIATSSRPSSARSIPPPMHAPDRGSLRPWHPSESSPAFRPQGGPAFRRVASGDGCRSLGASLAGEWTSAG